MRGMAMSAPSDLLKPLSLRRDGPGLVIVWSDGRTGFVSFADLRANCPCAACTEERAKPPDPFRVLKGDEMVRREDLAPKAMTARGYYAYQIAWNDGHDTGIFTLEKLRGLCRFADQ